MSKSLSFSSSSLEQKVVKLGRINDQVRKLTDEYKDLVDQQTSALIHGNLNYHERMALTNKVNAAYTKLRTATAVQFATCEYLYIAIVSDNEVVGSNSFSMLPKTCEIIWGRVVNSHRDFALALQG